MSVKPSSSMSDDEIRAKLMMLPEVQAFYEKAFYETVQPSEEILRQGNSIYVAYQFGRTWNFGNDPTCNCDDITKELRLVVKVDSFGKTSMQLECLGRVSGGEAATVESIQKGTDLVVYPKTRITNACCHWSHFRWKTYYFPTAFLATILEWAVTRNLSRS